MEEIDKIHVLIQAFSKLVNERKELAAHKDNKFNKQFRRLLKDWSYLKIIVERIETADSNKNTTQLGLDLKTLYVFGRVFSESLICITSLFINYNTKLDWNKIGPFLKSVKENLNSESDGFKDFWEECEEPIENLCNLFRYRNFVLHERDSNTEWTLSWPGRSNLDNVCIYNVPWKEDRPSKKEVKTLNARTIVNELYIESSKIINYIESNL